MRIRFGGRQTSSYTSSPFFLSRSAAGSSNYPFVYQSVRVAKRFVRSRASCPSIVVLTRVWAAKGLSDHGIGASNELHRFFKERAFLASTRIETLLQGL